MRHLIFAVEIQRDAGFHLDLEDYLMGLLQLSSEMVCILTLLAVQFKGSKLSDHWIHEVHCA
jgi:hypothetical protein